VVKKLYGTGLELVENSRECAVDSISGKDWIKIGQKVSDRLKEWQKIFKILMPQVILSYFGT
jgi:hypothetical protein